MGEVVPVKEFQVLPLVDQYPLASVTVSCTLNAWLVVMEVAGPEEMLTAGAVESTVQETELVDEVFPRAS